MPLTMDAIRQAQARIAPYALKTPLLRMECLDAALGCQVYVKAECMQRTGSFKLRGAMNRALTLTPEERARGIVAASSGNHGRAISYAARLLGAKATVVMPRQAPEIKIQAIRALGAEVILCETSERFRLAEELCASRGATMVPPFNDETVMAGQGTVGLEIMEACPDMDVIVTPTSGGGLLGGGLSGLLLIVGGQQLVRHFLQLLLGINFIRHCAFLHSPFCFYISPPQPPGGPFPPRRCVSALLPG